MKIIIAPNSFKGGPNSFQTAEAIRSGFTQSKLNATYSLFPIADGGDHTMEVFHEFLGGSIQKTSVRGPLGEEVSASWLWNENNKTAVIESAKASGLSLLDINALNPKKAGTFGTGQLIVSALEKGAKKIILGIGGTATVDGGLGMMQALGAELYDKEGKIIGIQSNPLLVVSEISTEKIHPKMSSCEFIILCDVENPLIGINGAAHVFGPQKGADPSTVQMLETAMIRFNNIILKKTGKDYAASEGAGAAGGISVSLNAFFNAKMTSGVDFLIEQTNFAEQVKNADLLITAEGKSDSQTLEGKGPYGVAKKAKEYGVPVILLAGKAEDTDLLNQGFDVVLSVSNGPETLSEAIKNTVLHLRETSKQIGNLLAFKK